MVRGYHIIFGAYGFWLPNDPRGSWSNYVGSWELLRFGTATKTDETCSLASKQHEQWRRLAAKEKLKYPAVQFTGIQAKAVGDGFGHYVRSSGLPMWACAIMPEHVHLVVGSFRSTYEQIVIQLKAAATKELVAKSVHPFQHIRLPNGRPPKCFARGQWAPFLETDDDIRRAIRYVEAIP